MFYNSVLTSWDVELPSLTSANLMFRNSKLTEWHIDLPNLTDGDSMFHSALSLRSFRGDLSKLVKAYRMFYTTGLTSFETTSLDKLQDGSYMFEMRSDATHRFACESFDYDMPSLTNGRGMFSGARNLRRFTSTLPSLTNGTNMFSSCKLNLESVQTIARTIKDNSSMSTPPTLTLGMSKAIQDQMDAELALIRSKGWALTAQYN